MAWWIREAVTEESTPPLRPQMTLASPTRRRMLWTASETKSLIFQSPVQPQMS